MINSLEIRNFRCYESVSLSDLRRINILVGKNSSGKTAFLESIFVCGGLSPELALRVKAWRGLAVAMISDQAVIYRALWNDMFYSFDQRKEISVRLSGSPAVTRSLAIGYREQPELIPIEVQKGTQQAEARQLITFAWTDGGGNEYVLQPEVVGSQLRAKQVSGKPIQIMPISFYSSASVPSPEENAQYLSNLSIKHEEGAIVDFIKKEFDFVQDLSVESYSHAPTIYASVRGLAEKIPVNLLSTGVTKVLSLLLGMANQKGGVILIDELENGIYWDRLPFIWRGLLDFSRQYDAQIFVSTHSKECLEAASKVFNNGATKDVCVMRTERDNGTSILRQFSGVDALGAVEDDIDIR